MKKKSTLYASVEFDGEEDHVHLLITYPSKVAISSLVNSLKGVSSRLIRKRGHPSIQKKLWGDSLGRQAILLGVAVVLRFLFYANISKTNERQTKGKNSS